MLLRFLVGVVLVTRTESRHSTQPPYDLGPGVGEESLFSNMEALGFARRAGICSLAVGIMALSPGAPGGLGRPTSRLGAQSNVRMPIGKTGEDITTANSIFGQVFVTVYLSAHVSTTYLRPSRQMHAMPQTHHFMSSLRRMLMPP